MKSRHRIPAAAIVALLALATYGVYRTQPGAPRLIKSRAKIASSDTGPVVNDAALRTAQALVRMPTTADELPFAQNALRLADQEMDLAFAEAVRQAAAHPEPMSAEAKTIQQRVQRVSGRLATDSATITHLTETIKKKGATPALTDSLNLAKSRQELHQDALQDAREDLMEAGGDPQAHMEAMVQEHEEMSRSSDSTHIKVTPSPDLAGLVQGARALLALRGKDHQLQAAAAAAESSGVSLAAQHKSLDSAAEKQNASTDSAAPANGVADTGRAVASSLLVATQRRVLAQKSRSTTERRGDTQHRLAGVYVKWLDVVSVQERVLANHLLRGGAIILAIALVWLFIDPLVIRLFSATSMDRRSMQTLRVITRVALQILGVLMICVVLIGVPGNLGTIIGLATAGLTVALKDFIVAFVGWVVLMGKNGIRVGDLVEINGITGEVVELGMFNTILHEMGNWTDNGHPTGRRVTLTNSYAIEGHYFNFSTSKQWLWDEVRIVVPNGKDPHVVVDALQKDVEEATAESARLAEKEWTGAHRSPGSTTVTSAPAITLKPIMGGVEVTLRYITHAAERYQVRSKLYHSAVSVLGGDAATTVPAG